MRRQTIQCRRTSRWSKLACQWDSIASNASAKFAVRQRIKHGCTRQGGKKLQTRVYANKRAVKEYNQAKSAGRNPNKPRCMKKKGKRGGPKKCQDEPCHLCEEPMVKDDYGDFICVCWDDLCQPTTKEIDYSPPWMAFRFSSPLEQACLVCGCSSELDSSFGDRLCWCDSLLWDRVCTGLLKTVILDL